MEDLHKNPFQSQPIRTADLLKDQESQRAQARNFSFEKMRLNFQDDKSNVETSDNKNDDLLQKLKSVEGNLSCQDHPDEEIQFYSFTNDRALCSECILSGLYTGCEVLSLKKAGDRIRPKFQELLKELTTKTEQLNLLQGGSENKANQGSGSDSKVKDEIKAQFDKLRAAIDKKEKEILAKYNVEENEAPSVSTADKAQVLKQMQEKISEIQEVLNSKLKTLKEVDLCQYYHDKSKLIRDFLNGECTTKIKDLTRPALSTNAREQPNPNEYKDAINKLIEAVDNLKEKAPDDFKSKAQSLQSRFSSNPEPEREKEKSEILIENGVSPPALLKLMSNISEGPNEFPVRPRSVSPFRALRKELEIISPLPVLSKEPSSPGTATEENLRRLLDRVEDMKKGPLQGNRETKKETKIQGMSRLNLANIQTQSMARLNLFEVNGQGGANVNAQTHMHTQSNPKLSHQGESLKEKDPTKKFWETYKELIEDQNSKKKPLTNSTAKLGDVEKNKPVPRSFIPDFAKSKLGLGTASETYASPSKYSSPSSQGLASTKNLRSVLQDDTKQASAWRLQAKRDEERRTPNSNASKSFGTNSLSTNLRKLKKEMGLDD